MLDSSAGISLPEYLSSSVSLPGPEGQRTYPPRHLRSEHIVELVVALRQRVPLIRIQRRGVIPSAFGEPRPWRTHVGPDDRVIGDDLVGCNAGEGSLESQCQPFSAERDEEPGGGAGRDLPY